MEWISCGYWKANDICCNIFSAQRSQASSQIGIDCACAVCSKFYCACVTFKLDFLLFTWNILGLGAWWLYLVACHCCKDDVGGFYCTRIQIGAIWNGQVCLTASNCRTCLRMDKDPLAIMHSSGAIQTAAGNVICIVRSDPTTLHPPFSACKATSRRIEFAFLRRFISPLK